MRRVATHEGRAVEGAHGRAAPCRARAGAASRLRRDRGAARPQRGDARPTERHGLSGAAPPGARGTDPGGLVDRRRPASANLPADSPWAEGPWPGTAGLAGLCRGHRVAARRPNVTLPEPELDRFLGELRGRLGGTRAAVEAVDEIRDHLL